MIRHRTLVLAIAAVHAAALAGAAWASGGVAALSAYGTWLAIVGATIALVVEAGGQTRDDNDGMPLLETATGLALLALVVFATLRAAHLDGRFAMFAGALIFAGIGLRFAAIRALGRGFATRARADDVLVESGLYAWLRHPSELGLALLAGGFALLAAHPLSLALYLLLLVIAAVRVRREERVLERKHGNRYRLYRARITRTTRERRTPYGR